MSDGREASVGVRGRVVAVLLTHRGQICLLRRSAAVRSDRGRWHCVTGYLPDGTSATDQALAEVAEETGLARQDLVSFTHGPVLCLADPRGGTWIVHSYLGEARHPNITLNWENDATRWVSPDQLGGLPVVPWLSDVATAVGWVVSGC
ncbi:NUDIX domain-containing protein [Streptomyces spiralis]|uniref:NUDIX domain-containing protein n=1 Tax=Streptomyces spiralis TaxID=66376 RepID=UPI0033EC55E0